MIFATTSAGKLRAPVPTAGIATEESFLDDANSNALSKDVRST